MSKRVASSPDRRRAEPCALAEHERVARTRPDDELEFSDWLIWFAAGDLLHDEAESGVAAVGPRDHVARLTELMRRTAEMAKRRDEHNAESQKIADAAKQPASTTPTKPKPADREEGPT